MLTDGVGWKLISVMGWIEGAGVAWFGLLCRMGGMEVTESLGLVGGMDGVGLIRLKMHNGGLGWWWDWWGKVGPDWWV